MEKTMKEARVKFSGEDLLQFNLLKERLKIQEEFYGADAEALRMAVILANMYWEILPHRLLTFIEKRDITLLERKMGYRKRTFSPDQPTGSRDKRIADSDKRDMTRP